MVHCRSGARSQKAALILKNAGFTNVSNLAGGILAWADKIDPTHAEVLTLHVTEQDTNRTGRRYGPVHFDFGK